jgi:ribosome modulation factor
MLSPGQGLIALTFHVHGCPGQAIAKRMARERIEAATKEHEEMMLSRRRRQVCPFRISPARWSPLLSGPRRADL